ncbi:MAG: ATP-binding protein, partial [Armatimonadetes bacterium]|nr:ATP-binding protein [Armatimonadota bacterium]
GDRSPLPARFIVLGSASPSLLRQSSESLAGRIEIVAMSGFSMEEIGAAALPEHWLRGALPPAFLASSDDDGAIWRRSFLQTIVERDVPQLGVTIPAATLMRFWTMVAHCHGGIWNSADPARSLGLSETTVRRYLDILAGLFMVRQLPPWHENLAKRQVKSPKTYIRDSGLLHALLGIRSVGDVLTHPKCGASWEGYIVEETLKAMRPEEAYFWATHQGAELDLLLLKDGRRYGVEIKRQDAPRMTPSIRIALRDLALEHLTVLYPGDRPYRLADNVSVLPATALARAGGMDPLELVASPPVRREASRRMVQP